jgi:hypothetical protein
MNGYPGIDMYAIGDPASLQRVGKTLYGGANYYRYDTLSNITGVLDYPFVGPAAEHYHILNSNFDGDTSLHKLNYRLISTDRSQRPRQ